MGPPTPQHGRAWRAPGGVPTHDRVATPLAHPPGPALNMPDPGGTAHVVESAIGEPAGFDVARDGAITTTALWRTTGALLLRPALSGAAYGNRTRTLSSAPVSNSSSVAGGDPAGLLCVRIWSINASISASRLLCCSTVCAPRALFDLKGDLRKLGWLGAQPVFEPRLFGLTSRSRWSGARMRSLVRA